MILITGLEALKSIVIVEDDPIIAELVRWRIDNLGGYHVSGIFANGKEAVETCRRDPPDVVLMDIGLAGDIDGVEAAKLIKEESEVPVIFLTAHTDGPILKRAKEIGPDGFIRKPFDDDDLRIALKLAL